MTTTRESELVADAHANARGFLQARHALAGQGRAVGTLFGEATRHVLGLAIERAEEAALDTAQAWRLAYEEAARDRDAAAGVVSILRADVNHYRGALRRALATLNLVAERDPGIAPMSDLIVQLTEILGGPLAELPPADIAGHTDEEPF